jgi:hypothetical protein
MALDCKTDGKTTPDVSNKLTSINKVLDILLGAFNLAKKPSPDIPPFLLLAGAKLKPGMSARNLSANIISRMESDIGIPMGDVFADGPNAIASTMLVQSQEHISHIQQNARISTAISPGSVLVSGIGSSAVGPVPFQGSNITATSVKGIIE